MALEDYKEIVGSAAGVVTILQCFAPAFLCKDIIKKGSTSGVDPLPFIGGITMCILMLQHGIILKDPAMIPVNIFGIALNISYFFCYFYYCKERNVLMSSVSKAVVLVAVLIAYANWESKENVEYRFGMIVTVLMLSLIGAPLMSLGEIIRKKDTSSLPFPLIVSGSLVTSLWLLYGMCIHNVFVQIQNLVALSLCLIQLSLFVIFPSRPPAEDKKKSK